MGMTATESGNKPLVSVLIPAFNAEATIAETLRSVCAQQYRNLEIVVVDDGSSDATCAEVMKAQQAHEQVELKLIRQSNRGASVARNHAFRECRGDLIQWLDADDLLCHNKIELQVASLESPGQLLSCAWASFRYDLAQAKQVRTDLWRSQSAVEFMLAKMMGNLYMVPCSWLVSRQLTEAAGAWDELLSNDDDGEYFARVLAQCEGIRFVEGPVVYYRRLGTGLSALDKGSGRMESMRRAAEKQIAILRSLEQSERVDRACSIYWNRIEAEFRRVECGGLRRMARRLKRAVVALAAERPGRGTISI